MSDSNLQLQWTDEQWNKVRQVVYEEARRARVAGNFLPLYGPLEPDARYVSDEYLTYGRAPPSVAVPLTGATISVDDLDTLRLTTLQVELFLTGAQVADPQLSSALTAFRRAANIVARLEDEVVFNGQPYRGQRPDLRPLLASAPIRTTAVGDVIGGDPSDGLLGPADAENPSGLPTERPQNSQTETFQGLQIPNRRSRYIVPAPSVPAPPKGRVAAPQQGQYGGQASSSTNGNRLVAMVSSAIGILEGAHHLGPFACVLGNQYFTDVQTPQEGSNVLPHDRILPFLGGGALLRTSTLPGDVGLVIALGGEPIDLVVGTDISVKFLQATLDPRFVFRVYEKVVLRIKQPDAIAVLHI